MANKTQSPLFWLWLLLTGTALLSVQGATAAEQPPSIAEATAAADFYPGYFDFYYQPSDGHNLLAIDNWDQDFLYASALSTGVGSNDIGLDRGQLAGGKVVRFERHANKVFLKHRNLQYRAVSAAQQSQALNALLNSISAQVLVIPDAILELIPPKPIGYSRTRESFPLRTAQGIDYATIAETAADHVISGILQPQRLARLNIWHGQDPSLPSVNQVADLLLQYSFYSSHQPGASGTVQRGTNNVVLYRLMSLLRSDNTDNQVKAQIGLVVHELESWLEQTLSQELDTAWQANYQLALDEIALWFNSHNAQSLLTEPIAMPPGAPI